LQKFPASILERLTKYCDDVISEFLYERGKKKYIKNKAGMLQAGGQGEAYAPLDFGRPEGAAGQRQRAALLLISFDYS
jgi:hypothetical protein